MTIFALVRQYSNFMEIYGLFLTEAEAEACQGLVHDSLYHEALRARSPDSAPMPYLEPPLTILRTNYTRIALDNFGIIFDNTKSL